MIYRLVTLLMLMAGLMSVAGGQVHSTTRVRISSEVARGLVRSRVDPVYPPLARQARIQGTVIVRVFVSKTGDVESAELISGHPMLAPAAIEAVKQWKYQPYVLNGVPIAFETQVSVNFSLKAPPSNDSDGEAPKGVVGSVPGGIPAEEPGGIANSNPDHPTQPAVPQRVRVSSAVESAMLLHKVDPTYPPEAKKQRVEGIVALKAIIDNQGYVAQLDLISGHPLLATAAMDAVKQWEYRPYLLNGEPVEVETQVLVNFTLGK